jgi:UDP-N-acetylmuramoyl-L-alanyl-D-glutamate--2,6-diaminopimelate ligase
MIAAPAACARRPHAWGTSVARDSRRVAGGAVYVACGAPAERSAHIAEARSRGAAAVIAEDATGDPDVVVANARWTFARLSASSQHADALAFPLVGVGGTKGKTTTSWCAWWCMAGRGPAARIGTVGWFDGQVERSNPQTTPPPDELHAFLAGLGPVAGCAMELSSHGCDQHRGAGLRFAAMAFTGLGHDHLDYHRTRGAYLAAKLRAFRWLQPGGLAVINADDPSAAAAVHAARAADARVVRLGLRAGDSRIADAGGGWHLDHGGLRLPLAVHLPGTFNAWNAAAGALLAHGAGVDLAEACARLASMPPPPGRMELLAQAPATYVDYAHTPESIANAVHAARLGHPAARVAIVFGCGGDRDTSKREPMGRAASGADLVVVTTDNARSEDPSAIAAMVVRGCPGAVVELDRGAAIRLARERVGRDGVVVVAGKGHEDYQIIGGKTVPWDDRAFVRGLQVGSP